MIFFVASAASEAAHFAAGEPALCGVGVGANDHERRERSSAVAAFVDFWLGEVGNVDELLEARCEVAPDMRLNDGTPGKRRQAYSPANAISHAQADGQGRSELTRAAPNVAYDHLRRSSQHID